MASHDIVIVRVVRSNLRVEVAHVDLDVTLRNLIYNGIELVVNVSFVLHLGSIGCRVTLDYGQISIPLVTIILSLISSYFIGAMWA